VDITAFIRELLFSHDCVIIPGFGGFIGNYTPARIDKTTSTFYPPVKQISFNRNLNHNDGLLVGKISESSKVNYGDARDIVEVFVTSIRKKLEKGEKVVFDNVGSFINNQEGNIQFEPDLNVNYHLDSYGLESFQFPPLERYDVRKRVARHTDKEPVRFASMRKILWKAAVIIPILALLVAVSLRTELFKQKIETTTLNPLATAEFENNKKAVDETIVTEPVKKEEISVTAPDNDKPFLVSAAENDLTLTEQTGAYYLITGSFKLKENADYLADVLLKEGFSPEILPAPNGFYRVSAMRCDDLNTALGKKTVIGKKFPGTWVKKI
jgi:nucleoid DNA-binding protein